MRNLLLFIALLSNCMTVLAAPGSQDHAQIRETVAAFVRQQTAALPGKASYQVNDIDPRIVLPYCARLDAFLPAGSQLIGKTSIGVRCADNNGWSILVPVQIRLSLDLLVSARQLQSGQVLQEEDLARQTIEITRTTGFTDPGQVVGKVLRYGIAAGQVLRDDMLRQPYSVVQGQTVQIVAQGKGYTIRNEGVALNNAGTGQPVQVRIGAGRVISGVARASGIVEIDP
ncbi:MAG: flagellar basal body P-ring formation protein FlgA [Nitrosomonadales bacterium]|nr:flagellar basal body P-ring formation protein FlgA [Nitrosomonadales bacterium]